MDEDEVVGEVDAETDGQEDEEEEEVIEMQQFTSQLGPQDIHQGDFWFETETLDQEQQTWS